MSHEITRESAGTNNEMRSVTPVCSCGWRGQPVYRWQDLQHALVNDQISRHRQESREGNEAE